MARAEAIGADYIEKLEDDGYEVTIDKMLNNGEDTSDGYKWVITAYMDPSHEVRAEDLSFPQALRMVKGAIEARA